MDTALVTQVKARRYIQALEGVKGHKLLVEGMDAVRLEPFEIGSCRSDNFIAVLAGI